MSTFTIFKRSTFIASIVSLASLAIAPTPSFAIQVDFGTWSTFGDVTTPSLGQANLSNDGLESDDFPATSGKFSYTNTTPAGDAFGSLQTFLGVSNAALDIGGSAWEGSAIKSTYTAQAGDKFNFNWQFLTNEGINNDFAFLVVNGAVTKLADVTNATNSSTFFISETGVNSFSYTFNSTGNYTLALGVVDVEDFSATSALEISNANLEQVPEPTTLLGLFTGLGFGVNMIRRFGSLRR